MKKHYINILIIVSFFSLMGFASPSPEENTPPSLADHIHLSKDPVDGGWLPNLTGLPTKEEIASLTQHVSDVMMKENDSNCKQIDSNLRMMVFQHFAIHQEMANAQNIYFDEGIARKWAHVLAMILKESSGDSTSITDMTGRSVSTYQSKTNLQHWKNLLVVTKKQIKMNFQTNFGLTQTSADRLFNAFHLAKNQSYDTEFLEGIQGASTPRKISLNTAIAIRRLIWFYQDFAQGRTQQWEKRIHQKDINKPEYATRYQEGLQTALMYCGTRFLFHKQGPKDPTSLRRAMAYISYCKLGNPQTGYGKSRFDAKCFAAWATLCPNLNIDIALITPLSYFATRGAKPVCLGTFNRLLNKKPAIK